MDIEELVVIYKTEKSWTSGRLSTIDNLLDRAAYGNSDDQKKLIEEYDELEQRMDVLRDVADLIGKVNEINRLISLLNTNINNITCCNGNESKLDDLNKEIENLEREKDALLNEIANTLNVNQKTKNQSNTR